MKVTQYIITNMRDIIGLGAMGTFLLAHVAAETSPWFYKGIFYITSKTPAKSLHICLKGTLSLLPVCGKEICPFILYYLYSPFAKYSQS
jgi:hypothetical protein